MLANAVLFFLGLGFTGLGAVNPGTAPLWFGLAATFIVVAILRTTMVRSWLSGLLGRSAELVAPKAVPLPIPIQTGGAGPSPDRGGQKRMSFADAVVSEANEQVAVLYRAAALPAYNALHTLLGLAANALTAEDGAPFMVGILIDRHIRDEAQADLAALSNAIHERKPSQRPLGQLFRCYQGQVTWLHNASALLGPKFTTDKMIIQMHEDWVALDKDFLSHLKQLAARSGFEDLRAEAEGVGWGGGDRWRRLNEVTLPATKGPASNASKRSAPRTAGTPRRSAP